MSKEKGSSFEEIRASGKCTVPLYFAPVLEPFTFDDGVEASSSTPADAEMVEEEDASKPKESSGEHDDWDEDNDVDYDDED